MSSNDEVRRVNQRLDQIESAHHKAQRRATLLEKGLQEVQDLKVTVEQSIAKAEKFKTLTKLSTTLAKLEANLADSRVEKEQLDAVMKKLADLQATVDFFAQKVSSLT